MSFAGTRPPENESESEVEAKKGDLQAEEKAVVLALRDTFIPGLRGSDAVMFATLLADLFPGVDLPTVFESLGVLDGKTPMNEPVSNLEEIPATFQRSQEISHTEHEGNKIAFHFSVLIGRIELVLASLNEKVQCAHSFFPPQLSMRFVLPEKENGAARIHGQGRSGLNEF